MSSPMLMSATRAQLSALLVVGAMLALAAPLEAQLRHSRPFTENYPLGYGFDHNYGAAGALDYNCGSVAYDTHAGSDYPLPIGTNVLASQAGRVVYVHDGCPSWSSGAGDPCGGFCGNYVLLQHADGARTIYCHMQVSSIPVRVGQDVSCGQVLGRSASSGSSTGAHLHHEWRRPGSFTARDLYRGACHDAESLWVSQGAYRQPPAASCGCTPSCDGSVLRNRDCSVGDCAAFGASCVSDDLGARCVFAGCPARGETTICFGDNRRGECRDGALVAQGDCGLFGATCEVVEGAGRCVFAGCPATGSRRACLDENRIMTCNEGAAQDIGDCSAFGGRCVDDELGARCAFAFCPPRGEAEICWDETRIGTCNDGALVSQGDCAEFAAFCSTAGDRPARCVSAFCTPDRDTLPTASRSCWFEPGRIAVCDDDGQFRLEDCPEGQQCADTGGEVRCVDAVCPTDADETFVCLDENLLARCGGGNVSGTVDCSERGGRCVSAPEGARCETTDAGAPETDGGSISVDASVGRDASVPADGGPRELGATTGGCSCAVEPNHPGRVPAGLLAGAVVVFSLRRRRSSREASRPTTPSRHLHPVG